MHLHDRLRICLLAVASRYPDHRIDFNADLVGRCEVEPKGWTADEVIEILQATNPTYLDMEAHLLLEECESGLYLPELSEGVPAFVVHCHGRIPRQRGNIASWRAKQYPLASVR